MAGVYESCTYHLSASLTSGSIASNGVYQYHEVAGLQTDAITIYPDVAGALPDASFAPPLRRTNHSIVMVVRYHSGYDIGPVDPALKLQKAYDIMKWLRERPILNDEFVMLEEFTTNFNADFTESQTRGVEFQFNYRVPERFTLV